MGDKNITLNFYIDKVHFPYQYQDDLNFNNKQLVDLLGSPDSWMVWTLRTYLELKPHYTCKLTDTIPPVGITFFFRGSINFTQKPNKNQFWICTVADSVWHPYSQINLFQNRLASVKYPESCFIRLWNQPNIIKSSLANSVPKNIYYFGDKANLAPELLSDDWQSFIAKNDFIFKIPHFSQWNDYSETDVMIGIRSFNANDPFLNKPASKLINAWLANTVFIGGNDSAFSYERETEFDYICVKSYEELKEVLLKLKNNRDLFIKYRSQAINCSNRFPPDFFVNQWITLIDHKIIPFYKEFATKSIVDHYRFLFSRLITHKTETIGLRLKRMFTSKSI